MSRSRKAMAGGMDIAGLDIAKRFGTLIQKCRFLSLFSIEAA
jgi:hypothetical protein